MHTSKFSVCQLLSITSVCKLCSICVHRSVQGLEFYSVINIPLPILFTRSIIGRALVGAPSNVHYQVWCLSAPLHHICLKTLLHVCPSIHSKFRNLQHNQMSSAHIRTTRFNLEGCSRLSVELTPPSLLPINSSLSPLSAKLCSMCVHRPVQN